MKIDDYYKAKPKMDVLEQINTIKDPIVDLLNTLNDPEYRYEGNYQSQTFSGHPNKCNVRLMTGNKTLVKLDNKELAIKVLSAIVDSLNTISTDVEKEIKKI